MFPRNAIAAAAIAWVMLAGLPACETDPGPEVDCQLLDEYGNNHPTVVIANHFGKFQCLKHDPDLQSAEHQVTVMLDGTGLALFKEYQNDNWDTGDAFIREDGKLQLNRQEGGPWICDDLDIMYGLLISFRTDEFQCSASAFTADCTIGTGVWDCQPFTEGTLVYEYELTLNFDRGFLIQEKVSGGETWFKWDLGAYVSDKTKVQFINPREKFAPRVPRIVNGSVAGHTLMLDNVGPGNVRCTKR